MGIKPSKCKSIFYNLQLPNYLNIKIFLLLTPEFLKFTYPTKQNFYFQKISLSPLFLPLFSLSLRSSSLFALPPSSPSHTLSLPLSLYQPEIHVICLLLLFRSFIVKSDTEFLCLTRDLSVIGFDTCHIYKINKAPGPVLT